MFLIQNIFLHFSVIYKCDSSLKSLVKRRRLYLTNVSSILMHNKLPAAQTKVFPSFGKSMSLLITNFVVLKTLFIIAKSFLITC